MYIRRKCFSEDNKKKLSTSDKVDLALLKLTPKKLAEEDADYYGEDEEAFKRVAKKRMKRDVIGMGGGLGIGGAIVGGLEKGKKGAAVGALAGAAGGAALAYGSNKATDALVKKLKKRANKKGEAAYEKYVDECNVRSGRMSKDDFIEKYGK